MSSKEAFLLKADGESFYREDGLSDGHLQGLLRDVGVLFQRAIQSIKLILCKETISPKERKRGKTN